ncbi:hypothetical protein LOAG_04547 [Loa loa]|uniref:Uncharacterized protein n=1 Tax=Loa loa TaxID=7209 RepID=A0A1S0U3J9_LOALO|nr:hypothetical protein LOAG_04547 [Loa loa]EFO23935.1 hypothetical protein LOAG_04547 [Loa loa]
MTKNTIYYVIACNRLAKNKEALFHFNCWVKNGKQVVILSFLPDIAGRVGVVKSNKHQLSTIISRENMHRFSAWLQAGLVHLADTGMLPVKLLQTSGLCHLAKYSTSSLFYPVNNCILRRLETI